MLYVHKLNQFNQKAAELESVYLIRELKQKTPFPFQDAQIQELLSEFLVSDTDKAHIEQALPIIEPTLELVNKLVNEKNEIHESANCIRTAQILRELPVPIQNSLLYVYDLHNWQKQFTQEITPLLNSLNKLRTPEQKNLANSRLKDIFKKILRNDEFVFKYPDLVNEGEVAAVDGLIESLDRGFLFHYSLEEELKKASFADIRRRLPAQHLEEAEKIRQNMLIIKRGVDRAQQVNMRMINLAIVLYAYVKWLTSQM